jgi:mRNA interferase HigB
MAEWVHIISRKRLREFASRHADAEAALDAWFRIARGARWRNMMDLRATWPSADAVGDLIVFNIKGNAYRLIARVHFQAQVLYVRAVLTHAEYDRESWKTL